MASSGALHNITSYLNGTLANLTTVLHGSSEYLSETLGIPPGVVYSSLAALVAVPLTMSRYGWSSNRDQTSPYTSMSGGVPAVTDDDFQYITSQDLDDPLLGTSDGQYQSRSRSAAPPAPADDVLLIKNKGVTYPAHFPAYSIGDGQLFVRDVRDRVGIMMDLSERATRRIRLLYKGRQLKDAEATVREYGVKNKSELMAVLPEMHDGSSASDEEMVIVDSGRDESKSRKKKKKKSKKSSNRNSDSASSPRDSNSTFDPPKSPDPPASGPMKKLDELAMAFTTKWLPLCDQYYASPPKDTKKREDEHRKLSESILAQILLKLDEVDTEGQADVRTRRKEIVKQVQEALKRLDTVKSS